MPQFEIEVPEVHYQIRSIEADTLEEAFSLVQGGAGDDKGFEYSHTLEPGDHCWMGRPAADKFATHKWDGEKIVLR